jgi:hypothetical protein
MEYPVADLSSQANEQISNFKQKQRQIEKNKRNLLNPHRIHQLGTTLGKIAEGQALEAAADFVEAITPAFIVRMRNKVKYAARIAETEQLVLLFLCWHFFECYILPG